MPQSVQLDPRRLGYVPPQEKKPTKRQLPPLIQATLPRLQGERREVTEPPPSTVKPWFAKFMEMTGDFTGGLLDPESTAMGTGEMSPYEGIGALTGATLGAPFMAATALPRGMWSRLQRAVGAIPSRSVHPNKLASLNVSPQEVEFTGLRGLLDAHGPAPLETQKVKDYVQDNPLGIGETVYGGRNAMPTSEMEEFQRYAEMAPSERRAHAQRFNELAGKLERQETQHSQHTLPGGKDYQERVLSWEGPFQEKNFRTMDRQTLGETTNPELQAVIRERLARTPDTANDFLQPKPNITNHAFPVDNAIGWSRSDIRETPSGPMRFVDEFQSDVHQRGAKEGYKQPVDDVKRQQTLDAIRAWADKNAEELLMADDRLFAGRAYDPEDAAGRLRHYVLGVENGQIAPRDDVDTERLRELMSEFAPLRQARFEASQINNLVPNAPGKDHAWLDMLFKRELIDAAENDLAGVAWAPGSVHQARWQGHGNPTLYDSVLPKRAQKIAQQFGGRVEPVGRIRGRELDWQNTQLPSPTDIDELANQLMGQSSVQSILGVRLTPQMKQLIKEKGFYALTPLMAASLGINQTGQE